MNKKRPLRLMQLTLLSISLIATKCNYMSEVIIDHTTGTNGSFEVVQNKLPVNWQLYSPETVPGGKFKVIIDTTEYKEGKQSLKFDVEKCSSEGGWKSPGLTKQFELENNNSYLLTFWLKNKGAEFRVKAGGVKAKTGDMNTLIQYNKDLLDWTKFEFKIPLTDDYNQLRFEVNVLRPGILWIDDVSLIKVI